VAARLSIVRDAEREWRETDPNWPGKAKPGEPGLSYKSLMDQPNLKRVRYEPGHFEPPHSHDEDEILYLLDGVIEFGDQTIGKGDSVFVPRNTRYSLRAGREGAEFVRVGFR